MRTRPTLNTCGHKYYSSKHGKVGTDKCLGSIRSTIMEDDFVKVIMLGVTLTLTLNPYCHVLWVNDQTKCYLVDERAHNGGTNLTVSTMSSSLARLTLSSHVNTCRRTFLGCRWESELTSSIALMTSNECESRLRGLNWRCCPISKTGSTRVFCFRKRNTSCYALLLLLRIYRLVR